MQYHGTRCHSRCHMTLFPSPNPSSSPIPRPPPPPPHSPLALLSYLMPFFHRNPSTPLPSCLFIFDSLRIVSFYLKERKETISAQTRFSLMSGQTHECSATQYCFQARNPFQTLAIPNPELQLSAIQFSAGNLCQPLDL